MKIFNIASVLETSLNALIYYLSMYEVQKLCVLSLGQEDSLQKGMATHSSILAWRISWTEKPGRLQSTGCKEADTTEATFRPSYPDPISPARCMVNWCEINLTKKQCVLRRWLRSSHHLVEENSKNKRVWLYLKAGTSLKRNKETKMKACNTTVAAIFLK